MRFQFPDGQTVMMDQPFSRDGVNYPSNWLRSMTPDERTLWGLQPYQEPPVVDGRWYSAPGVPHPLEDLKRTKLAELASVRYQKETGGHMGFRTDRESQALLTGAALAATIDAGYTVDWKGSDGWVTMNATQLLQAAQLIRAHVQSCFSNERAHSAAIAALQTQQEVIDYDITTGWPS